MADQFAKDAATGRAPGEGLPEGYAEETSLAHMTRVATEARSKRTTEWITAHVRSGRRYRPPPGKGVRRTQLRRVRKTLAGRYYQLLSGHAETGTHRSLFGRTDTPDCWWCASGEPQSRHHLFTRCPAWRPQTRRLWKDIGKACEWERPRALSVRHLWDLRVHERRHGVPAHDEDRVHRHRESTPGGQGGGQGRRGGGPRPALD